METNSEKIIQSQENISTQQQKQQKPDNKISENFLSTSSIQVDKFLTAITSVDQISSKTLQSQEKIILSIEDLQQRMLKIYANEKDFQQQARLAKQKLSSSLSKIQGLRGRVIKMHLKIAEIKRKIKFQDFQVEAVQEDNKNNNNKLKLKLQNKQQ